MRTSRRLTLLTIAVSAAALIAGIASPSVAATPSLRPAVVGDLGPEASIEQINTRAERILGERLPGRVSQLMTVEAPRPLTDAQIAALASGRDADGVRRLGEVRDPSPSTTLNEVARQIGVGDVVWWECIVIVWGDWEIWICRPLVLRA